LDAPATTCPPRATTAPIGASSCSSACSACRNASRIRFASGGSNSSVIPEKRLSARVPAALTPSHHHYRDSMSRPLRSRHTLHVRSRGLLLLGMTLALLTGVLQTAAASAASHPPHR